MNENILTATAKLVNELGILIDRASDTLHNNKIDDVDELREGLEEHFILINESFKKLKNSLSKKSEKIDPFWD